MAKIFGLRELEAKKRALVAESEVYRQTLKIEIQNLRLYRARVQRKFAFLRYLNPLLAAAGSLVGARFFGGRGTSRKRGKWSRFFGAAVLGWRLARQFGAQARRLFLKRFSAGHSSSPRPQERARVM